jgi:transcription initiation factor TFIIE subunit alpha
VISLKKLKDPVLYTFIFRLVGDEGVDVIERMKEKETTDERIAEDTEVELNLVRRTLYMLYEKRLATYRRERDEDSGWLTYLWRLNLDNFDEILKSELCKFADIIESRLKFEENLFYICTTEPPCCRLLFDDAVEIEFTCPMCGAPLEHFDSQQRQELIRDHLTRIRAKVG